MHAVVKAWLRWSSRLTARVGWVHMSMCIHVYDGLVLVEEVGISRVGLIGSGLEYHVSWTTLADVGH